MTQADTSWRWYDDNAEIYEEMDPVTLEFGRQLLDYADPAPGTRLLDVGAGRGALVRGAVDRGCVVTAVDAAPAMVARLRADFPAITVSTMDAHRFDFPDASFDVVTAGFVLDLLDDPASAVAEARRVLRPRGVFAVSLPGPLPYRERWQWLVELAREFYPRDGRRNPTIHCGHTGAAGRCRVRRLEPQGLHASGAGARAGRVVGAVHLAAADRGVGRLDRLAATRAGRRVPPPVLRRGGAHARRGRHHPRPLHDLAPRPGALTDLLDQGT